MHKHIENTTDAIIGTIKKFFFPPNESENPQTKESMLTVRAVINKKYIISEFPLNTFSPVIVYSDFRKKVCRNV